MRKSSLMAATLIGLLGISTSAKAATMVDLELSLLVDLSGSVDSNEYTEQIQGYIDAFNNIDFTGKNLATNFIVWSSSNEQQIAVDWTQINDNASAQAFSNAIAAALLPENTQRPFAGSTAPGSAINFAVPLFGTETGGVDNGFDSATQVIDVSGDGSENDGANTLTARDNALLAGVDTINGLPILGSESGLDTWYQDNVVGGTGSFLEVATGFNTFSDVVAKKIGLEICTDPNGCNPVKTPEPMTVGALLGLSIFGFGFKRKCA
jgi:Protein of unknown function (DUF1194)